MELHLTGKEVHALRESLENLLPGIEKQISGLKDPEARRELEARKEALRSIREKLPAALTETA